MERKDTIQELRDLKSILQDFPAGNIYAVPAGYFDNFSEYMLSRIKALNASNPTEELNYLAPVLNTINKEILYTVPNGYFEALPESLMAAVRNHEDYQTAAEELTSLSPLLNGIGKHNPYSLPAGYFENLETGINLRSESKPAKIISITSRKWFRLAAAAVVVGFIALTGISLFFNNTPVPVSNTHAWVEENMKKVSTDDINSFIQPAEASSNNTVAISAKTTDILELMKDVSDKDIQNFLNETNTAEENNDDLLLN